jgi:hypothetical protein
MLDRTLLDEAIRELQTPLPRSEAGEAAAVAQFVASSMQLEGVDSTPESVKAAVAASPSAC